MTIILITLFTCSSINRQCDLREQVAYSYYGVCLFFKYPDTKSMANSDALVCPFVLTTDNAGVRVLEYL